MLSKCLNSHCSATFQYFGQGKLFRVDFADAGRKRAQAGKEMVASIRSKACPIEHFWLCEDCAAFMTIELSDGGEVRLLPNQIPNQVSARKPVVAAGLRKDVRSDAAREATATAS
jgi:hypothetical protein